MFATFKNRLDDTSLLHTKSTMNFKATEVTLHHFNRSYFSAAKEHLLKCEEPVLFLDIETEAGTIFCMCQQIQFEEA